MLVDPHPFPYLKSGDYIGLAFGEIVILDKTMPEDKKNWIKAEYKKWWDEKQRQKWEQEEE